MGSNLFRALPLCVASRICSLRDQSRNDGIWYPASKLSGEFPSTHRKPILGYLLENRVAMTEDMRLA
jgi:hypothetical protein